MRQRGTRAVYPADVLTASDIDVTRRSPSIHRILTISLSEPARFPTVRYGVLGNLEVTGDAGPVVIRRAKERLLLAVLLASPGTTVPRDRLVSILWPTEAAKDPNHALQTAVSRLRSTLDGESRAADSLIVAERGGYRIAADAHAIDAGRFERLVAMAATRGGDHELVLELLDQALSLWRGPPFAEWADDEWPRMQITGLVELRLTGLELRHAALLGLGRHDESIDELSWLVEEHPDRELLWRQLAMALVASGRRDEAMEVLARGRAATGDPGVLPDSLLDTGPTIARPLLDDGFPRTDGNFPDPVRPFVGRRSELAAVVRSLQRFRVVTVTGPSGVGKATLAIEAAHQHRAQFPGGRWWTNLELARDEDDLDRVVLRALGLKPRPGGHGRQALVDHFSAGPSLLAVSRCEHIVAATAELVGALVHACPELIVLTATRQRLGLGGEAVHVIAPLPLPDDDRNGDDAGDAVELFTALARRASPDLALDSAARATAAQIVSRLGGMPLAIALAATRAEHDSLDEIAAGLTAELRPVPDAVAAAVDWSLELLGETDRVVAESVSVLGAPFGVADAAAVCPVEVSENEAFEAILRLLDRSILVSLREADSTEARFGMLGSLRSHALGRLERSGRLDDTRRRHWRLVSNHVDEVGSRSVDPADHLRLAAAERTAEELERAFPWAIENEPAEALRLVRSLAWSLASAGVVGPLRQLAAEALAANPEPSVDRAMVQLLRVVQELPVGELGGENVRFGLPWEERSPPHERLTASLDAVLPQVEEALAYIAERGEAQLLGVALSRSGSIFGRLEQYDWARDNYERAIDILAETGPRAEMDAARLGLANTLTAGGDLDGAEKVARTALNDSVDLSGASPIVWYDVLGRVERARNANDDAYEHFLAAHQQALMTGDDLAAAHYAVEIGHIQVRRGLFDDGAFWFDRGLRRYRGLVHRRGMATATLGHGLIAERRGDYPVARAWCEDALAMLGGTGDPTARATALAALGRVEEHAGDYAAADAYHRSSLEIGGPNPTAVNTSRSFEGLAVVAMHTGDPERAALLIGAADTTRTRARLPLPAHWRLPVHEAIDAARLALGPARFEEVRGWGAALSSVEARAIGLEKSSGSQPAAAVDDTG